MADQKITALTALVAPATTDVLPIVDLSGAPVTKKVTVAALNAADGNRPSDGEKSALAGTSGVPGVGNEYVTDDDTRNSDARTPTAHVHAPAEVTGTAVITTDLRLSDDRPPTAHATDHENSGSDEINVAGLSGVLADPQPPIIGVGAAQAVAGNDARLTDARTPTAHATSHQPGGGDAMAVDAAAATGSLRTIGTSALTAAAGNDARFTDARVPTAHATSHKTGGSDAVKLDELAAPTDNATLDVSTTAHGLVPKAVAPAAGLQNVLGIRNGESAPTHRAIFDTTNPAALGTVGPGTQLVAARRDHIHANPAIDTLAAATDIATLDASTTAHGLLKKLSNVSTQFMNGVGNWATPAGGDGAGLRHTFRGLRLGTHMDWYDKAAKCVLLNHIDEAIFDDGTRVATGMDLLEADITAAGAGGLDTGSEAVSLWYDINLIRKSSDGTLALMLHKSNYWAGDNSFTTTPDASRVLRLATGTATDKLAQGIQFVTANSLEFVDVKIQRTGGPAGNVWFTLEADVAGNPSGTPLATSDKLYASGIASAVGLEARIFFRVPYTPALSTQYHLVMQGDYTRSDTAYITWVGVAAGGYANGSGKQYNGTTWSAATGVGDFYFSLSGSTRTSAVTMPSGYDQRCHIGHVYNDSAGDFKQFVAFDRDIKLRLHYPVVSVGTAVAPTLVSLVTVVPPVRCMVGIRCKPSAAGTIYMGSDLSISDGSWRNYGQWIYFSATQNGQEVPGIVPSVSQAMTYAVETMASADIYVGGYTW